MRDSSIFDPKLLEELGVVDWGYTEESRSRTFSQFVEWTKKSLHLPLNYLADHRRDLREDLRLIYPDFQSALVFLFSYKDTKKWMLENNHHDVAAYTLGFGGEDYHFTLKTRLERIFTSINRPGLEAFYSLDAQPVLERDLALRAGLGWFGKNSMLINQKEGSYFIIGSILLNQKLPLEVLSPDTDHCGQCTACADACPTNAIDLTTRTLKASQCISTFTIEIFKEAKPPEGFQVSRGEIFGCDICQDVCPWNKKPLVRAKSDFTLKSSFSFLEEWLFDWPKEKLLSFIKEESNRSFKKKLFGTPFDRPGKEGWLKNLKANISSSQNDLSKKSKGKE